MVCLRLTCPRCRAKKAKRTAERRRAGLSSLPPRPFSGSVYRVPPQRAVLSNVDSPLRDHEAASPLPTSYHRTASSSVASGPSKLSDSSREECRLRSSDVRRSGSLSTSVQRPVASRLSDQVALLHQILHFFSAQLGVKKLRG